MTEPSYLTALRASYDTVAVDYAELYGNALASMPLTRAMLAAFAELVRASGDGPVADIGCGPGHVAAHLHALGVPVFGIDLSPRMVEVARRRYPGLRFQAGSMTALDLGDDELGGIVAWYSTHHIPSEQLPTVFAEFCRTLAPGGHLLLGTHVGDEHRQLEHAYGHPVSIGIHLQQPDRIAELLAEAGLVVTARLMEEPGEGQKRQHACLLARKSG
ncbi:class I SAM-dependent DNA methyltransferase [Nonomuraea africana]|uniref:class I SAM-dependent DNA methyltransferase n=1 Tax=Nonomuraea africana TaxID=46171 RepID=UPI0034044FD8